MENSFDLSLNRLGNHLNTSLYSSAEDRNDSSYLVPNYPIREPTFYIPRMPSITKVPEPKAPKKPPPPGYDMRTLRKQLEFYNDELQERTTTQALLYSQNEQLWLYIQDLLESSKTNGNMMRKHVLQLHNELKVAHKERFLMAEKLAQARDSKQMLDTLRAELHAFQVDLEDTERTRAEAEEALAEAKSENSALESTLHDQVKKIQGVHNQLDEYRLQQQENMAYDAADEFFSTNKAVLKSAYTRFRTAIQLRCRHSKIFQVFKAIYSQYLKNMCMRGWCLYMERRWFLMRCERNRNHDRVMLCMVRWKLYAALEKTFNNAHTRLITGRVFRAWAKEAKNIKYDSWALRVTAELHDFQLKRRILREWRHSITFLGWNSPRVRLLEPLARRHFTKKVLNEWRRVAHNSATVLKHTVTLMIPVVLCHRAFSGWKTACQVVWRRKGLLLRRFFRRSRRMLVDRIENQLSRKFANAVWIGIQKQRALKQWRKYWIRCVRYKTGARNGSSVRRLRAVQAVNGTGGSVGVGIGPIKPVRGIMNTTNGARQWRQIIPISPVLMSTPSQPRFTPGVVGANLTAQKLSIPNPLSLSLPPFPATSSSLSSAALIVSSVQQKSLRMAMLSWCVCAAVLHRQHLCDRTSVMFYIHRLQSKAISRWYYLTQLCVKKRRKHCYRVMTAVVQSWKHFTTKSKREAAQKSAIQSLQSRRQEAILYETLHHWRRRAKHHKYIDWAGSRCARRRSLSTMRTLFVAWRCGWSSALYWRHREALLEQARLVQLSNLNDLEIREMELELVKQRQTTSTLEGTLDELQKELQERSDSLLEQQRALYDKTTEKQNMEIQLQTVQRELLDAQRDRERLRAYEERLQLDKDQLQNEILRRRADAESLVHRLQVEGEELRQEVDTVRLQALAAERAASEQLKWEREQANLIQSRAHEAKQAVERKRQELEKQQLEQAVLLQGIADAQRRLEGAKIDAATLDEEHDLTVEAVVHQNQQLKTEISMVEARIEALIHLDERGRLHRMEQEEQSCTVNEHESDEDDKEEEEEEATLAELAALREQFSEDVQLLSSSVASLTNRAAAASSNYIKDDSVEHSAYDALGQKPSSMDSSLDCGTSKTQ